MIETGDRNFWLAQTLGWGLVMLSNTIVQYIAGFPIFLLLVNSIFPFFAGFLITTIYRYFIKRRTWKNWSVGKVIFMIVVSTIIMTVLFLCTAFPIISKLLNIPFEWVGMLSNAMIFAIVFLIWNLIYFFIHYFNNWNKAEVEKWKLIAEKKDAELGSLKSQINPHFVFNAINNIRALILEDKIKARDMLLNFSDLFRYSLKNTDQSTVSLKEELEIVNQYLELLAIQYESKLKYRIDVDPALESMTMPPMMLQLLVENAIKHGISQFKEGGSINIIIDRGDGF